MESPSFHGWLLFCDAHRHRNRFRTQSPQSISRKPGRNVLPRTFPASPSVFGAPDSQPVESPPMNPFQVLQRHYNPDSPIYQILVIHSVLVARKAHQIARRYLERHPDASVDLDFLTEAALLHDIGIKGCRSEKIPLTGSEPYIRHGVLGAGILEEERLPRHARVCERHVGAGISREDVVRRDLPLPARDFLPQSIEEKIICVADKFFGKSPGKLWRREKLSKIEEKLGRYGPDTLMRWELLCREILDR